MAVNYKPLAANGLSVLAPLTSMQLDQYLDSPNKRFRLIFQNDSNLVLWDGTSAVWAANSGTPFSTEVYPQRGTGFPVSLAYIYYNLGVSDIQRQRIWNSTNSTPLDGNTTAASQRTFLQVQDDGNVVIIDAIPVWASNTSIPVTPDQPSILIPPGTLIFPGQRFTAGKTTLLFQTDGNLVLYGENNSVIWATYTENKGGVMAAMQTDGNFVIYDGAGKALWYTSTNAFPGSHACIQANGSFSIVINKVVWARFGFTPTVKARAVYYPDHTDPLENSTQPYPTYGHIGYEF